MHKGDVLFEIDPRPLNAVLAQAGRSWPRPRRNSPRARATSNAIRPWPQQQAIAQSQLDTEIQAQRAAQANVQSHKAAVETAQLNVGFTKVTSLIDGVAAIATAQIGDLVGPATLLTTVSQVIADQGVLRRERSWNTCRWPDGSTAAAKPWAGGAGADADPRRRQRVSAAAARSSPPIARSTPKTGTIRISATFPNPDHTLRPGQYGRVRAETHVRTDALLVPQRAVTELQGSFQIRVVGPDNKVSTKTVKVGDRVGSRWIVDDGACSPATRVVVEGAVRPDGTVVNPEAIRPVRPEGH